MSQETAARIREAIRDHGPITFAEFMEHALYGPGGFFEHPPIGAEAHFVTSPHVHAFVFSHCLRAALLDHWAALGEPDPFDVVELGAGDGTLAEALRSAFEELPLPALRYLGVDVSGGARERLRERGFDALGTIDEVEPFEGVVLAHELLDNLPFRLLHGGPDGVVETRIALEGDGLVQIEVPWEPPTSEAAEVHLEPGERSTVPVGAFDLLDRLAERLTRGYALIVDYGREGPAGGAHGYLRHRLVHDVLADPGSTDVTAGVDLSLIVRHAERRGLHAFASVTQARALDVLGYGSWATTMRERQSVLQQEGRGAEATRIWQARSRASVLVDPEGLGAFRWLVLSTEGLPEPAWLEDSRSRSDG